MAKQKHNRSRMSAVDALALVDDDGIGEGAQMMMAAELCGGDYESMCMDIAADADAGALKSERNKKPNTSKMTVRRRITHK